MLAATTMAVAVIMGDGLQLRASGGLQIPPLPDAATLAAGPAYENHRSDDKLFRDHPVGAGFTEKKEALRSWFAGDPGLARGPREALQKYDVQLLMPKMKDLHQTKRWMLAPSENKAQALRWGIGAEKSASSEFVGLRWIDDELPPEVASNLERRCIFPASDGDGTRAVVHVDTLLQIVAGVEAGEVPIGRFNQNHSIRTTLVLMSHKRFQPGQDVYGFELTSIQRRHDRKQGEPKNEKEAVNEFSISWKIDLDCGQEVVDKAINKEKIKAEKKPGVDSWAVFTG